MHADKIWLFLCILFVSEIAFAELSKSELASLPPYCDRKYREVNKWVTGLGLHHYCGGLSHLQKYYSARTERDRKKYYEKAMRQMNYHLIKNKRTLSRNPLAGEIYATRGKLYSLAGKHAEAIADWYKAIEVRPRTRSAYLDLASHLKRYGQKDEALKVITQGLRQLPKSKVLQKRYVELGGELPYPEPVKTKRSK